jgi:hypothetical protein
VLLWSTVFFCSRGGQFLYRFRLEKRQIFRRGHIPKNANSANEFLKNFDFNSLKGSYLLVLDPYDNKFYEFTEKALKDFAKRGKEAQDRAGAKGLTWADIRGMAQSSGSSAFMGTYKKDIIEAIDDGIRLGFPRIYQTLQDNKLLPEHGLPGKAHSFGPDGTKNTQSPRGEWTWGSSGLGAKGGYKFQLPNGGTFNIGGGMSYLPGQSGKKPGFRMDFGVTIIY